MHDTVTLIRSCSITRAVLQFLPCGTQDAWLDADKEARIAVAGWLFTQFMNGLGTRKRSALPLAIIPPYDDALDERTMATWLNEDRLVSYMWLRRVRPFPVDDNWWWSFFMRRAFGDADGTLPFDVSVWSPAYGPMCRWVIMLLSEDSTCFVAMQPFPQFYGAVVGAAADPSRRWHAPPTPLLLFPRCLSFDEARARAVQRCANSGYTVTADLTEALRNKCCYLSGILVLPDEATSTVDWAELCTVDGVSSTIVLHCRRVPPGISIASLYVVQECASNTCLDMNCMALGLTDLLGLDLSGCTSVLRLTGLAMLPSLRIFFAPPRCREITDLFVPSKLLHLDLSHLSGLVKLGGLAGAPASVSLFLPRAVRELTRTAFSYAALRELDLAQLTELRLIDGASSMPHLQLVKLPVNLEEVGVTAFIDCPKLVEVDMSHCVKLCSIWGFARCGLMRLTLPAALNEIGSTAFESCVALRRVDLSLTALRSIDGFQLCAALQEVTLPATLEVVGPAAFAFCAALRCIDLSVSARLREIHGVKHCIELVDLMFPPSLSIVGPSAFVGCSALRVVDLRMCTGLREVRGFGSCARLQHVHLPRIPITLSEQLVSLISYNGATMIVP